MIAARHKTGAPRVNNAAANYFLALRQTGGVLAIVFFVFIAWLSTHLPLPIVYIAVCGYGLGLTLLFLGALLAPQGRVSGKAMLGSGSAIVFILTVSLLFDRAVFHLPGHPYGSIALCMAMLILFAMLAWLAASQSVSLLTLSLGVYLTYVVAPELSSTGFDIFLFIETLALVLWICLWTTYRRERLFTHFSVFLAYGALFAMGYREVSQPAWIVSTSTLLYISMTVLVVDQVFRDHARHRSLFFFSSVNTLIYILIGLALFVTDTTGYLWFILGSVCAVSICATVILILVHGEGQLISMYAVAAVLALLILLLLPLMPGFRLVMLSAGCLAPAVLSFWRHDKLLRLTEYGLLITLFFSSFALRSTADFISLGVIAVPTQWAWILAAVAVLCFTSWLHAFRIKVKGEIVSYSVECYLPALACAITAALMITIHTIMSRGDSEALPFIFAAQGMVLMGVGMVLSVPAIAVAGLVPVVAGHTIYYTFPYLLSTAAWAAAETQPEHIYTLAVVTLVLALYADFQVFSKIREQGGIYQKLLAVIPYLPFVVLLFISILNAPAAYLSAVAGIIALLLLLLTAWRFLSLPGIYALGVLMTGLSIRLFFLGIFVSRTPVYSLTWFLPLLWCYLVCLLFIERLFSLYLVPDFWKQRLFSYCFIIAIAVAGAVGLYHWNSGRIYFLALISLALLLILSGRFFHAKGYYHVAAVVLFVAFSFLLLFGSQGMNTAANMLVVK